MKNVAVTLSEEVALWARVRAAERNTSLSRMLGELLRQKMEAERNYTLAMETFLDKKPRELKRTEEVYPGRELLHER